MKNVNQLDDINDKIALYEISEISVWMKGLTCL